MSFRRCYFSLILIFSCFFAGAQMKNKDYTNIMRSQNIYEIDAFLRDAHPDEPRRAILKPRLVKMLKEYIKNASPEDQRVKDFQEKIALLRRKPSTRITFDEMNENIRQKQIAFFQAELQRKSPQKYTTIAYKSGAGTAGGSAEGSAGLSSAVADAEMEEFAMLMNVNPVQHKNNTVKVLNSLFDNDPNSKECIVLVENKSDCNIIMRIEGVGNTKYRLAIPAQSQNTIVVSKGDYLFSSLVCGAQYASQKTLQKAIIVALGNASEK